MRVIALAGLALLAGCTLRSIDDLQSGSALDGGTKVDSSTPSNDAAGSGLDAQVRFDDAQTTNDAALSANDAGATVDDASVADATVSPDAATPVTAWCPDPQHALCDDFESGPLQTTDTDVRPGWSFLEYLGNPSGMADLVDAGAAPDGRVFRSSVGPTSHEQSARLIAPLQTTGLDRINVAFDITVDFPLDNVPNDTVVQFAKLQQVVGDAYPGILLAGTPNGIWLSIDNVIAGKSVNAFSGYADPPASAHSRVQIELVFGSAGSVKVSYDGVIFFDVTSVQVGSPQAVDTYFQLGLYTTSAPVCSADYDDVFIEQL